MKLKACYIAIALFFVAFAAEAQHASVRNRFEADAIEGCASPSSPFTVTITTKSPWVCDSSNPCVMFYENGTTGQNLIFTHNYTQPGTYWLKVLFQTSGYDSIQVVVNPNIAPQFDVYTCGGNQVSVTVTDPNYDNYIVNYNDGTGDVILDRDINLKNTHTFASPGTKNITVRGLNNNASDNCASSNKTVQALVTLPVPTINTLTVLDDASVQLDFNGQPDIQYRLEIAPNTATTFQLLKTVYNSTSEIVSNLKTEDNYYCFRIGAYDPCNNTTVYSAVICSANFDLAVQNNSNTLTWTTRTSGVTNFRVSRTTDGSIITVTSLASPYTDTDLACGTEYCYQLITNYPNGSRSISLQKCGTAISTDPPDAIKNVSAVVNGNSAQLDWQNITGFTPDDFFVFKAENGSYNLLESTKDISFTDQRYTRENNVCYKIYYKDVCGNSSDFSPEACPINLNASLQSNNSIVLSWTAFTGWTNGVAEYIVEKYSVDGELLQTFTPGTALSLTDDANDLDYQTVVFVVRANAVENGISQSVSNTIVVIKNPNIFYPTAFTPNGDNLNDLFNVYGHYITDFELSIFNRWGELMYTTSAISEGWDGVFKGNAMPEGIYTFVADITDHAGRKFKRSGSVLLMRKK